MNMRNLLKQPLGALSKRLMGVFAVAGFFASGAMTATASAPAFNNLSNDYPTLQVAKAGENWSTATTAAVGDTVNLFVWDHNTVPGTTATDVNVKVTLPTTFATTHGLRADVSATNAATATGNATVGTGSAESKVTYVAGSAKLYRNVGGALTQVSWPSGVNPDTVVTTGVNLGNQDGCWQYAQAVLLQVRVEGGSPAINTTKQVQLDGGAAYSEATTAQPNDVVNFKVFLENTGNATGANAQISDDLDSRLAYVPNSSILKKKVNNQDVYEAIPDSSITKVGNKYTWSFGAMAPRPSSAIYLQFQTRVAAKEAFTIGTTHLENCAISSFTGLSKTSNCVAIDVTRQADSVVDFSLRKEVTNRTLGDSKWYDRQLASAAPGDSISYRLIVVNTGNTPASNVTLKDILPAGVTFEGNVKLYNKANPNGIAVSGNAIVNSGYVFSEIKNGTDEYQTIVFDAKITSDCNGTQTFVNNSQVIYNGAVKAQDDASLIISCTRGLIITKDVLNPATGTYQDSVTGFHEGDVLVFRINVQNNGNTPLTGVMVRDQLPDFVDYQAGSMTIDGEFMSATVANAFLNQGVLLTNLNPGMGKVITFRVKVTDCPPFGDTTIVNRAFAWADGVAAISDTATAIVKVTRPNLP